MTLRVVNLGLPKTGTTTLARALKMAGFKVADHRIRKKQTNIEELHGQYVGALLYRGHFESGDPAQHLTGFDAISELSLLRGGKSLWPQMDFSLIDAIRQHHPDVKFLASRRDSWKLSQSMLAWSDLGIERLPSNDVPGLPAGYGETTKERMMWIDGHYTFLATIFKGDKSYFEYDVEDADAQYLIGKHLGVELPWWGKANKNRQSETTS